MKEENLLRQRLKNRLDEDIPLDEADEVKALLQSDPELAAALTRLRLARYAVHLHAVKDMRERIKRWRAACKSRPAPVSPAATACILALLFSLLWNGDPGNAKAPALPMPPAIPTVAPIDTPIAEIPVKEIPKRRSVKKIRPANTPQAPVTIAQSSMKTIVVETEGNFYHLLAQRDEFLSRGVQVETYELSYGKMRFHLLCRDPDFVAP
ncbi:MAG: hypothetical protein SFV22_11390 [Saprospiraceae bacterium]|nr:hypothetical protein [Saprospiraceae bacterium]